LACATKNNEKKSLSTVPNYKLVGCGFPFWVRVGTLAGMNELAVIIVSLAPHPTQVVSLSGLELHLLYV
jgi:hypothetical protein